MHTRATDIAEWLKARVSAAGARGIAVGLSGGIDSAVVMGLAAMAMPGRVIGVMMPCHSDPQDETDARLAADHFGVPAIRVDLSPAYDRLLLDLRQATAGLPDDQRPVTTADEVDIRMRVPVANLKPRLRMTSLYFVANSLNYLVAGTGNRSELTIGYFTKYGDGGVDLLPIGRLLKSEVRVMAKELEVPAPIIEKPPSAGLWEGQTDESEMGFTYADLENYLALGPQTIAPALGLRIERLERASDHKRALPPTPEE
ncbi:MAG TPA: NAD(+) synthase [Vicinamibacterales bacterium]|nr:NAD(+) synthase [Vicinamibacterales bacterium]